MPSKADIRGRKLWAWIWHRRVRCLILPPLLLFIFIVMKYAPIYPHKPYCSSPNGHSGRSISYSPDLDSIYQEKFSTGNDFPYLTIGNRIYLANPKTFFLHRHDLHNDVLNAMNKSVRIIARGEHWNARPLPRPKPSDSKAYKLYYKYEQTPGGTTLVDDKKFIAWCKVVEYVTQKKKPPPFKLKFD